VSHRDEMKQELECLRLASDLTQLSREALDPGLREHCARMAAQWSDRANGGSAPGDDPERLVIDPPIVLLVEDEPLLLELAATLIEEAGFAVLQAGDADAALSLLETRSDIAVLFTDIDMPGSMDGLKLAQLAHHRWPLIATLVVSGKLRPPASELPPNGAFMAKPYRGAALITRLRSLVGKSDVTP
jgi:CheY-like chemotaxis protein